MSIAAEKISKEAFNDIFNLIELNAWLRPCTEGLIELWNFCETRAEQELLKSLLERFTVFDSEHERIALIKINEKIRMWGLSPKSTWVVGVADDGEVDGSAVGLQKLKNKIQPADEWHSRFFSSIPRAAAAIKSNDSVVLFDDFIGTGDKIERKINWLKTKCNERGAENIDVYVISYAGMESGLQKVEAIVPAKVFSCFDLKKGISDYYPLSVLQGCIDIMIGIEAKLGSRYNSKKLKDFSFGYGKSEALYCAENDNCPNNVFPVFWWAKNIDNSNRVTLLKRAG